MASGRSQNLSILQTNPILLAARRGPLSRRCPRDVVVTGEGLERSMTQDGLGVYDSETERLCRRSLLSEGGRLDWRIACGFERRGAKGESSRAPPFDALRPLSARYVSSRACSLEVGWARIEHRGGRKRALMLVGHPHHDGRDDSWTLSRGRTLDRSQAFETCSATRYLKKK